MRKITVIVLMLFTALSYSQVGINTNNPDASSALDITSTTGGLLVPRMTEAQRDDIGDTQSPPATGLMVYQTDQAAGFYFYGGTAWTKIDEVSPGTASGQIIYWDGTVWDKLDPPSGGATLIFQNGSLAWALTPPTLSSTTAVSSITMTTASSGGTISDDRGNSITARGVVWSTSVNPTTENSKTTDGSGTGSFTSNLTGLTEGTTYYIRAYATSIAGTSYGDEFSFTTLWFSGSIGDPYQGGVVAYILQVSDAGYVSGEVHGLIAATSDQSTSTVRWYNGFNTTTGASGNVLGTGFANTNAIILSQEEPATSYAAGLARAYAGGGFTDWYLPSKDELNKLYINRVAIGGFEIDVYWSSSEFDSSYALFQAFGDSFFVGEATKSDTYRVRAVRAF